ncbi:MAG: sodium-translocating pyrophosphatase [Candidatus Lokiarchaeota archaeon]|nr:sodium-translocating pyrophosphatase [Candidatus Lokiarchaeota archaeon]
MDYLYLLIIVLIAGIISIILALYFARMVLKEDPGNEKMVEVSGYIAEGAKTFVKVQYKVLAIFVLVLSAALLFLPSMVDQNLRLIPGALNWEQMVAYIVGSAASMGAGYLGMEVGVKANTRAAQACTKGLKKGFDVSFFGGAVMGLAVVGAALIGISVIYWVLPDPNVILGFSFGASSVALFAKCGGGIYTKTADVGADLVGKAEYDLPEDDPRNPASIADNVGDNVGDIAGMGSDLFDSYVASILAAMLLAAILSSFFAGTGENRQAFIILPILLSGMGLFASLVSIFYIKKKKTEDPGKSLNNGTYMATGIFIVFAGLISLIVSLIVKGDELLVWKVYACTIAGLASGILIGFIGNYYTNDEKKPTRKVAEAAQEGHAVVILSGFSYGLISVAPPAIGIAVAMAVAYWLAGVYGVAMAAVGMLSIVGTIVTNDAYGPICDNARGIAEQGDLGEEVIRTADKLDSAGNTAKAITKGFAIGAANLTVLALLFSFSQEVQAEAPALAYVMDLQNVSVLIGAFIGVIVPAIFAALLTLSVQRNAGKMVREIRRQFEENPKILTGDEAADFNKCIAIATKGALKELIFPSILSILTPLVIGMLFGAAALGAFLAGSILSGFVFAIFMSNAGGSWDNAKKYIEDGNLGGKGTETHKAAITGDTVGDPFKDTAGPSINTLLVVMSLTATIFLGFILLFGGGMGLLGEFLL